MYRLDEETGELTRRERTIDDESHDNAQHSDDVVDEDHNDGGADSTGASASDVHNSAAPVNDSAVSQNSPDNDQLILITPSLVPIIPRMTLTLMLMVLVCGRRRIRL